MSAQTSYDINQGKALAGLIYALAPHNIISRSVETTTGIEFARAVSRGTDADNQTVVGGNSFLGITIRSLENEGAAETGALKLEQNQTAGIMVEGYVWAVCPTGCVPGDAVNYNTTTGVLDSGAPVAGENSLDDASWETTAAAGELAVIRITGRSTTAGV